MYVHASAGTPIGLRSFRQAQPEQRQCRGGECTVCGGRTCISVTISPTDLFCRAELDRRRDLAYTISTSAVFTCTPPQAHPRCTHSTAQPHRQWLEHPNSKAARMQVSDQASSCCACEIGSRSADLCLALSCQAAPKVLHSSCAQHHCPYCALCVRRIVLQTASFPCIMSYSTV